MGGEAAHGLSSFPSVQQSVCIQRGMRGVGGEKTRVRACMPLGALKSDRLPQKE